MARKTLKIETRIGPYRDDYDGIITLFYGVWIFAVDISGFAKAGVFDAPAGGYGLNWIVDKIEVE